VEREEVTNNVGGFVMQGKVFQNRMIDLGITNNKLYHRACGIISKFGNVDENTAKLNLLRAIYSLKDSSSPVPDEILNAPISDHVKQVNEGMRRGEQERKRLIPPQKPKME
jgi:hypothetical protein